MTKKLLTIFLCFNLLNVYAQTAIWTKHEIGFESSKQYDNPIYEVKDFRIFFTSPSGRQKVVRGFWDGDTNWKVRFLPDETGNWSWRTECTDKENSGLHSKTGGFTCVQNSSAEAIFRRGAIRHLPGEYYLSHHDATPFFWLACTAWNGALKSTAEEWELYLNHRKKNNYNVIQLVVTEWRGCDKNAEGLTAMEGTGKIRIHPDFFRRIDKKMDEANAKGLVVSPVVLWALPVGQGRELSPGYTLPLDEAVLLAKYIVARYQGNHVVWTLGGDGRYYDDQEIKWKEIGRRVYNDIDHAPVTLHPHGSSWVGELFAQEDWYGLMGYQSSHSKGEKTVNWINQGPVSKMWGKLKPMPYINMEPNYEEIHFSISAKDVRNAAYWSVLATPVAGITYGANGIWPWLRKGESIQNHSDAPGTSTWQKSIDFPGSIQSGYLAGFFSKIAWWELRPANEILLNQPGKVTFNHWISVAKTPDDRLIIAYIPAATTVKISNPNHFTYSARWFDPVGNSYADAIVKQGAILELEQNFDGDRLILLERK
jgi:hypothetical protein